ncbi:AraC family transcriptional regulator [Pseudoflavitalea sp. G-6-1-2]|uniref:helix-turn-helix domain-containing protein n=1 Tax=Pseudoflavitalea sp. G-6-1-2 TaxID=2728841 RepID=UPI00146A2D9B|nr:helix-turn-helix domain-containing protein [Pseudoflavitalea sp. G-6-1-2]NML21247.1 AraC family transcriptional regulator [Pseudoflavitalea sp. G-6-1-2]
MQIAPHPALAHIVKHYLVLDGSFAQTRIYRLFADGNTGLVFNLSSSLFSTASGNAGNELCWLYGQVGSWHDLQLNGQINWLIAVLQPYGAHHLWNLPASELKDQFVPAELVLGKSAGIIAETLLQQKTVQQRIDLLDQFFLRQSGNQFQPDQLVKEAIHQISLSEGTISVHTLQQQLKVNERTLERRFKNQTGISPKHYSGIVRVNASAKKLQRKQRAGNLTQLAYESNYCDQAHFIRDFKKFTGITPQQYQQSAEALALNFFRI